MTASPGISPVPSRSPRSIEDFRGDFDELAQLMQRSWAENHAQPLLYTPEFLHSHFSLPGASFRLAPAIYDNSRLAGFVAGFPRRVRYRGEELPILLISFLTVANEYKRSGYGLVLREELLKRARAAGFAGTLSFCIEGDAMHGILARYNERNGLPASRILSIRYMRRLILAKPKASNAESVDDAWLEGFLAAAARASETLPFARVWTREDADWQCRQRAGAVVANHSSGGRHGFLAGYVMPIADGARTKCLLIDDILWNDLNLEERLALLEKLVNRAAGLGVRMAVVPLLGYADTEPFSRARFLPSPRVVHVYFRWLRGTVPPDPVSSLYIDVF